MDYKTYKRSSNAPIKHLFEKYKPCFPKTQWNECRWFVSNAEEWGCKHVLWSPELQEDGNRFRFCTHWKEIDKEVAKHQAIKEANKFTNSMKDLFEL